MALFHCMVRHGTVQYGSLLGGFPLGTVPVPGNFLVPPRLGFQAIRIVTKTWCVNSADHWLAGENRQLLRHWTCDMRPSSTARPARFKSAQPREGVDAAFVSPFCINHKWSVSLSVEEVQTFLSLIAEEWIQRELDGATPKEKALCI